MNLPYFHKSRPKLAPLTDELRTLAAHLRRDVETLALDIGPRGTFNPPRLALAADFVESALTKAGHRPARHWFISCDDVRCCNVEVTLPGATHPDRVLVLGAHYDSVIGCPAANDNASGVAGVLAIARAMLTPQPCTIRFVLFANEEPPHFNLDQTGSHFYVERCRENKDDIRGMVCLETIGCYKHEPNSQEWPVAGLEYLLPTIGDFIAFAGPDSARDLIADAARAFEAAHAFPLLAAAAPSSIQQINFSDHRAFNDARYPAFMVTDTAPYRYNHYHLETDTPDRLDFESMARVVSGMRGVISALASAP
jgi:hypothetical protein